MEPATVARAVLVSVVVPLTGCSLLLDVGVRDDAASCVTDLSSVGTGDFEISLTVTTAAAVRSALAFQRLVCSHSHFWEILMEPDGLVTVQLDDDDADNVVLISTTAANDGAPHSIQVDRTDGVVTLSVDGATESGQSSRTDLVMLPPLHTGTDGQNHPCVFELGVEQLDGAIEALCLRAD